MILNSMPYWERPSPVGKVHTKPPQPMKIVYDKKVQSNSIMFVDPRFEDEALSALMEDALSETTEETKFDVEAYFDSNIDYAWTI